jgi:hypothetical protein
MRFITIAIASAVLFFPTFWLFSSVVGVNWGAGIAAVAMYVAFPILGLKIWRPPASQNLPSMESALAAGELGAVEYEISEVVEIEECEDEGKHFFKAPDGLHTMSQHVLARQRLLVVEISGWRGRMPPEAVSGFLDSFVNNSATP